MNSVPDPLLNTPTLKVQLLLRVIGTALSSENVTMAVWVEPAGSDAEAGIWYCASAPLAVSVWTTGVSSVPSRNRRMLLATTRLSASAITALIKGSRSDSTLGSGDTATTLGRIVAVSVGTNAR